MGSPEEPPLTSQQAESFLSTLRRSVEVVQELLQATAHQDERIRSLDAELDSARARIAFLERETTQLRERLSTGIAPISMQQIEDLIEEQNAFAHMFVTSDRLARARSPGEALQIAVEVMHNLVGAHRFGIWLRWDGVAPQMVAPPDPRYQIEPGRHRALLERALATGEISRDDGADDDAVPVALPLVLDGAAVGALVIDGLVPQVGARMGRLQDDLSRFLIDRLPLTLCAAAQHVARGGDRAAWDLVRVHVAPVPAPAAEKTP